MTDQKPMGKLAVRAATKGAKREAKKRELAESAIEALKRYGYANTTLRDIAAQSELSLGMLHYYFENKEQLLIYCVRLYKEAFAADIGARIAGAKTREILFQAFAEGLAASIVEDAETHRLWYDIRNQALFDKAVRWRKLCGSVAGPWEAFLVHRGLMTLELRLARMCSNARALVPILEASPATQAVRYPGIGFVIGATFSGRAAAEQFIADCPAIFPSTSFGGVHTSAECRARWGDDVPDGYVRLSVGCEPEAALLDAIETTLAAL